MSEKLKDTLEAGIKAAVSKLEDGDCAVCRFTYHPILATIAGGCGAAIDLQIKDFYKVPPDKRTSAQNVAASLVEVGTHNWPTMTRAEVEACDQHAYIGSIEFAKSIMVGLSTEEPRIYEMICEAIRTGLEGEPYDIPGPSELGYVLGMLSIVGSSFFTMEGPGLHQIAARTVYVPEVGAFCITRSIKT